MIITVINSDERHRDGKTVDADDRKGDGNAVDADNRKRDDNEKTASPGLVWWTLQEAMTCAFFMTFVCVLQLLFFVVFPPAPSSPSRFPWPSTPPRCVYGVSFLCVWVVYAFGLFTLRPTHASPRRCRCPVV